MQKNTQRTILFLLGPTATGKTDIVINLLDKFTNTFEIISVDSVQIYKDCNVGSGKPNDAILKRYHHHLINHIDLNDTYNVARFVLDTTSLIDQIFERGNIPILVGGTMMYFNSLLKGITALPGRNITLREELEQLDTKELFHILQQECLKTSRSINSNDRLRIIRAIELNRVNTTNTNSIIKLDDTLRVVQIGISPRSRSSLHEKIAIRQPYLANDELINEAEHLLAKYQIAEHPIRKAVNYRQAFDLIEGLINNNEFYKKTLFATRQLAKRQITWIRSWEDLNIFDINKYKDIEKFLIRELKL